MDAWLQIALTGFVAVTGSSGFWAFLQYKDGVRKQNNRLLMGLAYDKIVSLGMSFIERGWITQDEYEEYRKLLYDPYKARGGNGVAERIVAEVSSLPLKSRAKYAELIQEKKPRRSEHERHKDGWPIHYSDG